MKKKPPMKQNSPDDFQTPPGALKPLLKYITPGATIWECACGKGNLSTALCADGFKVVSSDIKTGKDFLTYEPEHYDYIITNPPFSIKQEFLRRCYELGKPFALLLPLTTFETKKRQELFKKYGVQVIFMDKRINFETPNKVANSSSWFATAWFTNGLNLPGDLVFEEYIR